MGRASSAVWGSGTPRHAGRSARRQEFPEQGVLRLRRCVLNANSYLGGIVTSRLAEGRQNVVYGVDGIFRAFGQDYLTLNWAQSFDELEDTSAGDGALDRALIRSRWERRGQDGLIYGLGVVNAGRLFEPGMGYLRRRDYAMAEANVGYGWRPARATRGVLSFQLGFDGVLFRNNADGSIALR